jgi:ABC-2 type transport system ATP-binding protein
MTVIKTQDLKREFKKVNKKGFWKDVFKPEFVKVDAVKDINININQGESVAFLGPNGAGKTTTIKMLTGLIFPSAGKIDVLGYTPFDRKREFLMRIGLVMGNKAGLNWDLTPRQSFELLKEIYTIPNNEYLQRVRELTELLDTQKFLDTQVRRLSLGERMKMELIGAILHNPEILFLDEPTIGLDIISKQKIRDFLREIQQKSKVTLLLTSHDMDDVEKVCDRVIVINKGSKVYDDRIDILTNKYNKEKIVKFYFDKKPLISIADNMNVSQEDAASISFKVKKEDLPKFIAHITTISEVKDIDIISTPLEEIIADLYGK